MLCQTETLNKGLEHCGAGPGTKPLCPRERPCRGGMGGARGRRGKVETGGAKSLRAVQVN